MPRIDIFVQLEQRRGDLHLDRIDNAVCDALAMDGHRTAAEIRERIERHVILCSQYDKMNFPVIIRVYSSQLVGADQETLNLMTKVIESQIGVSDYRVFVHPLLEGSSG